MPATEQRITIIYPATPGTPFNWDHYMNKHLPLAVGTSQRHSDLNYCDVDKPLQVGDDTPTVCICVVHFATAEGMAAFRRFFATGHPESQAIIADEQNFTTIQPLFIAGRVLRQPLKYAAQPRYRVRFLVTAGGAAVLPVEKTVRGLTAVLEEHIAPTVKVSEAQIDIGESGIADDSTPVYRLIWTLYFTNRSHLQEFELLLDEGVLMNTIARVCGCVPIRQSNEILPFDLGLAAAFRDKSPLS